MKIHEAEGYNKKEIENYREEATRYKCLGFLKSQSIPGPFPTPEDVRNYLERSTDNPAKKNMRLYQEVTFARKSSKALKPTAAAFRLKRDGRNLDISEYSDNLISYLRDARSCKTLKLNDLSNVLFALSGTQKSATQNTSSDSSTENPDFDVGEHVAAFWVDVQGVNWHLGVVHECTDKLIIPYLIRKDKSGNEWVFPEEA